MTLATTNPFEGQERVGDFFAPFYTVRFLSADAQQGTQVDEDGAESTVEIQDSGEIAVSQGNSRIVFSEDERTSQFRSFATKLVVTNQGGGACMVELTLEPPLADGIRIADNRLLQWNSIMVVEWGWSSDNRQDASVSEKHYFVITQPKLEMKGTDVTITITGIDMFTSASTKRETRTIFRRTKPSPDGTQYSTDLMILEAVARKNKMRVNTTLAPAGVPIRLTKPLNSQDADSIEQNEKDYLFFRRICEMNRCDFFTIGDTIYVVDQNIARVQKVAFRLVYFTQPQESNDIPVINFSTQALPTLFFPAESKELVCKMADEDAGSFVSTSYDPQTMSDNEIMGPRSAGGKAEADGRTINISQDVQVVPNPRFARNETGKVMSCPSGLPNRDEHAKRIVRDANTIANTNADVTIPGVPSLCPMQIVRVEGVGRVFSGPYLVLKVVHRLSTDGYECDLTLIRESSTGDDVAGRGQRPVTGGNDPEQAPGGQAVQPVGPDEAP